MGTRLPGRPTYALQVALFGPAAAALYFIWADAMRFLNFSADSYGPYWNAGGWMLLHVCGGIAAVLLGAWQFALGLLGRTSQVHRWCGRVYVVAVLVSCCASFVVLAHGSAIGSGFAALVRVLALYTLAFTGLGLLAIRRGDRLAHREWMVRSYMGVMVFGFFRGAVETSLLSELPFAERFTALMGLTMSIALAGTELLIQLTLKPAPGPRDDGATPSRLERLRAAHSHEQ